MGANFLVSALSRSTGSVLLDPSLPLSDVDARINAAVIGYGRTFGVFARSATATFAMPYAWGDVSGNVGENRREVHRSGTADIQLRLSMSLMGAPALTPQEFAHRTPRTVVGASLTVVLPTGQYDPSRLVNLGSNRWAFKPELALSHPTGRWNLEAYAGAWLFTDNTAYRGHNRRRQDPIASVQAHVSYTMRPRLWLAFDATYYRGGDTTVNDLPAGGRQNNSRIGLTLSVPAADRQSLKFTWSEGATTRTGTDFRTFGIAWQYLWFD